MNGFVLFFFIPLSWFVTVFMIEAGSIVMTPICKYDNYREQMMLVLGSLWAIIATSLVYLVVSLDGIFAPVMYATGEALFGLLMTLIIILAFHHYLIGSAEGADALNRHSTSKLFLTLAMPFALIVAFIGNTIFTSVFSGYGIGLKLPLTTVATVLEKGELPAVLRAAPTTQVFYPNFSQMIFNGFNWVFFIGIVMYVMYFTIAFYGIKERFLVGLLALTLANALILASTALWLPTVFDSAVGNAGFWIYVILSYVLLYATTHYNIPWRQVWVFFLTFLGSMMFGAFTQGDILVDAVPPKGIPASLLLTNPTTLAVGSFVLALAGILVVGGVTAVSYVVLYKQAVEKAEAKKQVVK
ncbi:hypothetical protein [Acidianus manzaensis]|uniref:Uncharacterized protein n=1 Tax=Acidianus manzaensis TaxID=282676 RepID=A0A1W6K333_9CREN|nr:hypothetical protein [Acidianus manzaensis]ARM76900.1 hypothetical protein B6F84_13315 [Acidianus manzaensis]